MWKLKSQTSVPNRKYGACNNWWKGRKGNEHWGRCHRHSIVDIKYDLAYEEFMAHGKQG